MAVSFQLKIRARKEKGEKGNKDLLADLHSSLAYFCSELIL
jgi:hypothetical protein